MTSSRRATRMPVAFSAGAAAMLLEQAWRTDNHATVVDVVASDFHVDDGNVHTIRKGSGLFIDLMNAYKAFVPDLRFRFEDEPGTHADARIRFSASGLHVGRLLRIPPTGRVVRLRGSLAAARMRSGKWKITSGVLGCASLMNQIGLTGEQFHALLNRPSARVQIRVLQAASGVPVIFFPTMSLPGWITWARASAQLRRTRPIVSFQLIANRLALADAPVPRRYSLRTETASLQESLEESAIRGPFDLVGHSAGGTLALDYALTYPERVRSLTLIEAGLGWVLQGAGKMNEQLRREVAKRSHYYKGRMTAARYASFMKAIYGEKGFNPRASPFLWPLLRMYKHNAKFRTALIEHRGSLACLRAASFPVLLACGRESDPFHRAGAAALASLLRNVRTVTLPGGHVPHLGDRLPRFLRVLSEFHQGLLQ